MFLIRSSVASLFDGVSFSGVSLVSYPSRIWLGDKPVVSFLRLLCTADAIASHCVQSSGDVEVTKRRYCSTHWFFRSEMPSVWGWNAEERFCWIPNLLVRLFPKCDVKRGS